MNNDILKGKWNEFKGNVRERWAELTDNDVEEINGNMEQLIGKLQQRYGMAKDRASKEANSWMESLNKSVARPK
jgi:uncharacterized protein YjbJ (UPF0337 family)